MMNNKTKTTLQFLLAGILLASFTVTGCNNGSEKTETKTDSVTTEKSMEVAPAPMDTTMKRGDTASTRPTPGGG